jgi:cysteine dioxygenase
MLTMSSLPSALGHDSVKPYPSSCLDFEHETKDLPAPQLTAFDELVLDINRVLGPSNGIDSDGVDVQELMVLMEQYRSCRADWGRFAFAGTCTLRFNHPPDGIAHWGELCCKFGRWTTDHCFRSPLLADSSRAYTRNLVDRGNGKCNLVSSDADFRPIDWCQWRQADKELSVDPRLDPRQSFADS